jgi:peroxiredoxin
MFERSHRAFFWPLVYDSLSDHLKNSFPGKLLKEKILLSVGQPFPLFTLPGLDGKQLALKDVIAKSKLTIVQFYASNSVEVDHYQAELQHAYQVYHAKGLNIVGVCSDTSIRKWKIAAADLPWQQVSDLKGEEGVVGKVYHEYGFHGTPQPNTTNVLIDANGKIVSWDANGAELLYYLWKTFGE